MMRCPECDALPQNCACSRTSTRVESPRRFRAWLHQPFEGFVPWAIGAANALAIGWWYPPGVLWLVFGLLGSMLLAFVVERFTNFIDR